MVCPGDERIQMGICAGRNYMYRWTSMSFVLTRNDDESIDNLPRLMN